jgi:hypothetical protein
LTELSDLIEVDPRKLYVPQDVESIQVESKIVSNFGLNVRIGSVIGVTSPEGGNMLTTDNVLTVRELLSEAALAPTSTFA